MSGLGLMVPSAARAEAFRGLLGDVALRVEARDPLALAAADLADLETAVVEHASWVDVVAHLRDRGPELALIVIADPDAAETRAALHARHIVAAVGPGLPPRELAAALHAAREVAALRRQLAEHRQAAHRRIEAMATLNEIAASTTDLPSFEEVLAVVTRELHRVLPFDLVAVMLLLEESGPLLHLHCHAPCDATLLRATRDRCLEAFCTSTGRVVDEDLLKVELSGKPLLSAGHASRPAGSMQVPLVIDGRTVGLFFLTASESTSFSTDDRRMLFFLATRVADALRRLRARLSDERRRLGLMVESMADGLILTSLSSDEVLINPAARRLLGIDGDSLITQQFLKETLGFYPFDLVTTSKDTPGPLREEVRVKDKILHSMVSPVRDTTGKLEGVVVVLRDFTEAKALARRQAEFVSVVSHELRSPLTSIAGSIDIVLSDYAGRLNDKQRRYLQLARDSCGKLNQIVDDLLDVARSERGKMQIHFTPLLLDDLGREVVERFRAAAQAKKIRLVTKIDVAASRIVGDADRLTQVLNNLLSNAVKFTPEGGLVEVEIFGPQVVAGHVGVSVFNNGEPIPDDARERIFEKFERIESSMGRQVGGTGLGLAISRAIIEAHGGRIWAESRPSGAKFVFTLPAAPAAEVPPELPQEIDLSKAPNSVAGATVLLVDDDVYSSYILKGILMSVGHDVVLAETAEDALAAARTRRPALVVVSSDLKGDDGLALVKILKHDPDTRKSAVLVVVGAADREESLRAGADEALAKPIEPTQLREVCGRLIAEAGRARAQRILVVDDDANIRTICREVLQASGYTVREAANGLLALSEARRFKPDLVMLDVMMPDLDGFQTAEHLRGDTATSMVPIIFLSARGETADKVRAFRIGAEDYVVKPFVSAELVARVRKALERRERELGASPTTQLPGANAIEAEIERRLGERESAAICYLDLDNLKSFNDYYGYAKADGIIRQTADLIRDVINRVGNPNDFIGHIAGDDFVFITSIAEVDSVCSTICAGFDRLIPLYYNKVDRERGYIEAKDRFGVMRRFPIMSVSLAAVTTEGTAIKSYSELAAAAALGKKLAKAVEGSSYVRDGLVQGVGSGGTGPGSSDPEQVTGTG